MKSRHLKFSLSSAINHCRLHTCSCTLTLFLFFSSILIFGQTSKEQYFLKEKALLFKNRVEYDSALIYSERLNDILKIEGNNKQEVLNKINIYDLFILQRDFDRAGSGLNEISVLISDEYPGDIDIEADYYQVKGSFLLSTGITDSAKYYLLRSIRIRTSKYGSEDTMLHYAYNKLGNLYLAKSDFDSAYLYHQIALSLSLKKQNPVNYLTASSYQNLGIAAHYRGDYLLAEDCYLKSLNLKEKLFDYNDPALAKIYANLGKFYSDQSKYDMALIYYDRAEQLLISRYDRENIQFGYLYWNKGNVYTHKGDFIKATNYLEKAYSILESNLGPYHNDVMNVLLDLGFAYDKKADYPSAIEFYHKAAINKEIAGIIKIYRNLGNIYQFISAQDSSMGNIYQVNNAQDSAEKYYNLAIEYAKKIYPGVSYDLALCYQYYGEFLATSDKDGASLKYYALASDLFIKLFGRKNKDLSKVYRLESEYYLRKKAYDAALNKIQAALIALLPGFSINDPYKNPEMKDIIVDIYSQDAVWLKAIVLYSRFLCTNDHKDLILSRETIELTTAITEEIGKKYNEEESQLILNKNARNVIDLGVEVTFKLFVETGDSRYLSEAFQYSEKGKAIILLSALRGLEAQTNTDIPESLINSEKNLSRELAAYNNLLYSEKQKKNPDANKMKLWSDEIFSLRLSHDSILTSYKENYPDFFRLKYDHTTVSADSALSRLQNDQAILAYYITDSLVMGFLLADRKLTVQKLGEEKILKLSLDSLSRNFTSSDYFNSGQIEFNTITSAAAKLYDFLIRPFEGAIAGKRLIIIPDGDLGYLSFDLLLKNSPVDQTQSYSDLAWLIKSNPISYSSSTTIFFEQAAQASRKVSKDVLAFAPSYDFKSKIRDAGTIDSVMLNLSPIVGTKEEINSIAELFRTKKLFDENATESYFKEHAGGYGILHLAMHTIIDNKNSLYSKLVFSASKTGSGDDGYLNTYELFGLHLPGQLAVLSACNTGSGKLERGEGIISLARGFFYAGIPNVVMTLWEIEDHSSADLMALFYENLKKGLSSDVALQQAKISYLENAGKLQSHPYFWAGYVSIGKTNPINFTTAWRPEYIVISSIIVILIILLIIFFNNDRVFFHKKRY